MEFVVSATADPIDFGATGIAEILQNIRTILTTSTFSVPLHREFGVNATMLDAPLPVARARLTVEIISAIQRWEPRAKVIKVIYEGDGLEGIIKPKVRVRIDES